MRGPVRQAGLSYLGWLVVIAFAAVIVVAGLRLIPVYVEYYTVKSALHSVAAEQGVGVKSKRYIWDQLQKRLYVNDVKSVSIEDLSIEVDNSGQAIFHINYERRTKLVGNLDAVAVFEISVEAN